VVIERLVIRPIVDKSVADKSVADKSVLAVVVVFIGLLVIFNSVAGWIWTYTLKAFPSPFVGVMPSSRFMSAHEIGSTMITLVELALLYGFFRYTRLGLAMRAAAYNPMSSRLVGIPVDWMLALGWGLAAAIGAIAGMMVAPIVYLDPNMMTGILLYGFAGALLGGIDNPAGAVVGGFLVGVLENILGAYVIGTDLKLSFALILIVGVLTVKPSGLFGRTIVTRV
jgi:branched-chain amino acid transport system permease protein